MADAQLFPMLELSRVVEHDGSRRLMVFSGRSNPELASRIARRLDVELGAVTLKTFSNGEIYCRYDESVRGGDVFLVQSCSQGVDPGGMTMNDRLMELLIMADAAKLGSADRITAVVPWYPYSRQDKKSAPREPITARMVASIMHTAGIERVLTMDLHAGQVQGFFDGPVDHMTALPMFAQYFRDRGMSGPGVVVVSADAGRAKLAKKFAEMLDTTFAIISKERPAHNEARVMEVIGDVRGRQAIISDDMIDTAGTLCAGANAVKEAGATRVVACATHPLFSGPALERIESSALDEVVVCDTVPIPPAALSSRKVRVLPVDEILARTIGEIFHHGSVSQIFGGENQLF
jgi:ribose-phosphate pyrophosphokinase